MTDQKLAGKVVMMTGAGRGLGRSMALALAREGAKLALVDLDGEELQQVAGEVQDIGGRESVIPLGADVCDPDSSATAIFYAIENFGRLDVLFNNAAPGSAGSGGGSIWKPAKILGTRPLYVYPHGRCQCRGTAADGGVCGAQHAAERLGPDR